LVDFVLVLVLVLETGAVENESGMVPPKNFPKIFERTGPVLASCK
jgi:hypothetical protein